MTLKRRPGPLADQAFRLGVIAASLLGLAALGTLHWLVGLSPAAVALALLVGAPVYLIFVAVVLSGWLGFGKDASDLRPVTRERGQD